MHVDIADEVAEEMEAVESVTQARAFSPLGEHPSIGYDAAVSVGEDDGWGIEFTTERSSRGPPAVPVEVLRICVEHGLDVRRNADDGTWEAWPTDSGFTGA